MRTSVVSPAHTRRINCDWFCHRAARPCRRRGQDAYTTKIASVQCNYGDNYSFSSACIKLYVSQRSSRMFLQRPYPPILNRDASQRQVSNASEYPINKTYQTRTSMSGIDIPSTHPFFSCPRAVFDHGLSCLMLIDVNSTSCAC